MKMIIYGGPGTGKSQILKAFQDIAGDYILIGAMTAAAAHLVDGQTLHSLCRIPIPRTKRLSEQSKEVIRQNFENKIYLFCDEMGMIG